MPVAHIIARHKYLKNKSKVPEKHSPYKTAPWIGLYSDVKEGSSALSCCSSDVDITASEEVSKYKIRRVFLVEDQSRHFNFYFPISDCGQVDKLRVVVNEKPLVGEMMRRSRRKSSRLISSNDRADFLNTDSDENEEEIQRRSSAAKLGKPVAKREPTVFYFCLPKCSVAIFGETGAAPGSKIIVDVEVTTNTVERRANEIYNVIFPFTCVPRPPTSFRCQFFMKKTIRRVVSPNKSHDINPYLNDEKAEVILDIADGAQMNVSDFLFILQVELGEPIQPECIDPMTLFALVTAVGAFVFYMLTKELRYFHA